MDSLVTTAQEADNVNRGYSDDEVIEIRTPPSSRALPSKKPPAKKTRGRPAGSKNKKKGLAAGPIGAPLSLFSKRLKTAGTKIESTSALAADAANACLGNVEEPNEKHQRAPLSASSLLVDQSYWANNAFRTLRPQILKPIPIKEGAADSSAYNAKESASLPAPGANSPGRRSDDDLEPPGVITSGSQEVVQGRGSRVAGDPPERAIVWTHKAKHQKLTHARPGGRRSLRRGHVANDDGVQRSTKMEPALDMILLQGSLSDPHGEQVAPVVEPRAYVVRLVADDADETKALSEVVKHNSLLAVVECMLSDVSSVVASSHAAISSIPVEKSKTAAYPSADATVDGCVGGGGNEQFIGSAVVAPSARETTEPFPSSNISMLTNAAEETFVPGLESSDEANDRTLEQVGANSSAGPADNKKMCMRQCREAGTAERKTISTITSSPPKRAKARAKANADVEQSSSGGEVSRKLNPYFIDSAGYAEYHSMIAFSLKEFILAETMEAKRSIYDRFLAKFDFQGLTESKARKKVHKAFVSKKRKFEGLDAVAEQSPSKRAGRKSVSPWPVREKAVVPSPVRKKKSVVPSPAPAKKSPYLHQFLDGPYIEELAYHFFKGHATGKLDPLPPPGPVPQSPTDGTLVTWTYNPTTRVYLGDFSRVAQISLIHKRFLGQLMERDDIAVVSIGLIGAPKSQQQFLDRVGLDMGDDTYDKFRKFNRVETLGVVSYHEVDGSIRLKVADYLKDLADLEGSEIPAETVVYMTDVEMATRLQSLDEEYKRNFKMPEILPGGGWCLMNYVRRCACGAVALEALRN